MDEQHPPKQSKTADSVRFLVDINERYEDKVKPGDNRFWRFNMSFTTREATLRELLHHIRQGHAWTAPHHKKRQHRPKPGDPNYHTTYRIKDNVISAQLLALDSDKEDERSTFDWWLRDDFVAQYGGLLHTSASHTPNAPRCRVVFVLDEALNVEQAELAQRALLARYPHCDNAMKNIAQPVYGAQGCDYKLLDNVLPTAVLWRDVVEPYEAQLAAEEEERERLRAERLAAWKGQEPKANASQVARYIHTLVEEVVADVRDALPGGTGEASRHGQLRDAALRIGSLTAAHWLTSDARDVLAGAPTQLLAAAEANGYSAKYGAGEAERLLDEGLAIGSASPAPAPIWKHEATRFFQPGDVVDVRHPRGQIVARGTIANMRQARKGGHWEAQLDTTQTWFPRDWLCHAAAGDTQPTATGTAVPSPKHHADDTPKKQQQPAVEVDVAAPPAPPNWEGDELAQDFFTPPPQPDGRGRDIYANLVRGDDALVVNVPPGDYLTQDVLPYDKLPRLAMLNANTGVGKTTYALSIPGQKIIATSSTVALEQILARHPEAHAYYQQRKDATEDSQLIVTTYESYKHVLRMVDASRFYLIIDEGHNFAASSSKTYRHDALASVMDTLNGAWRGVLIMSGTPVPLSHPYTRQYKQVNVVSNVRSQKAQRVAWQRPKVDAAGNVVKNKDGEVVKVGRLRDALLANMDKDKTHLIFLNSKKARLEDYVAGMLARGWNHDEIYTLNSDNKLEDAGRAIIEDERIPDGCRVLIVTSVLVEAANLRDSFDCIHFADHLHPHLAQQFVNRLRTEAAGVVYWYNSGEGDDYGVNVHEVQRHILRQAQELAQKLNSLPHFDANDDSMEAIQARRELRQWMPSKRDDLTRMDEDVETGKRWWDVSYLAVDNATFTDVAEYTRRNPKAFKAMTRVFGWDWQPDVELVVEKVDKAVKQRQKELAAASKEEREARWEALLDDIGEQGELWAKEALKDSSTASSVKLRALTAVLKVKDTITSDWPDDATSSQHSEVFAAAVALVKDTNDSQRKMNTLIRQLRVQQYRGRDAFTKAIYNAFQVGERLTGEEIQERLLAVYEGDEVMALYVRERYQYPFSQDATTPLTPTRAVQLLGDAFNLKRQKKRDDNGERVNCYELVDDNPVGVPVSLSPPITKKKETKVRQVEGEAFAFGPSDMKHAPATQDAAREDVLDWYLATMT